MQDIAEFSGDSTDGNTVVFTAGTQTPIVGRQFRISMRSDKSSSPDSPSKIRRTAFGHMGLSGLKLAGFVDRGINSRVGNQLFSGRKTVDVANLRKNDGPINRANTGNGSDRGVELIHIGQDFLIQSCNLSFYEVKLFQH